MEWLQQRLPCLSVPKSRHAGNVCCSNSTQGPTYRRPLPHTSYLGKMSAWVCVNQTMAPIPITVSTLFESRSLNTSPSRHESNRPYIFACLLSENKQLVSIHGFHWLIQNYSFILDIFLWLIFSAYHSFLWLCAVPIQDVGVRMPSKIS